MLQGDFNASKIQSMMRTLSVPIICKIVDDTIVIDFRTVFEDDYALLIDGLTRAFKGDFHD